MVQKGGASRLFHGWAKRADALSAPRWNQGVRCCIRIHSPAGSVFVGLEMWSDWGYSPTPCMSVRGNRMKNAHHPASHRRRRSRSPGARPHLPLRQRIHQQRAAGQGAWLQAGRRGNVTVVQGTRPASAAALPPVVVAQQRLRLRPRPPTPARQQQRAKVPRLGCPRHSGVRAAQGGNAPCRAAQGIQQRRPERNALDLRNPSATPSARPNSGQPCRSESDIAGSSARLPACPRPQHSTN